MDILSGHKSERYHSSVTPFIYTASIIILIVASVYSQSFILSGTSIIAILSLFNKKIFRQFKIPLLCAACASVLLLTHLFSSHFEKPFHERARIAQSYWNKTVSIYRIQSESICSRLSSLSSALNIQEELSFSFQKMQQICTEEAIVPPSGMQWTDEEGNILAWEGHGFPLQGISEAPVQVFSLPAGSELVFVKKSPLGKFFLFLPLEYNNFYPKSLLNDTLTVRKWLRKNYAVFPLWIHDEKSSSSFMLNCDANNSFLLQPSSQNKAENPFQKNLIFFFTFFAVVALITFEIKILKSLPFRTSPSIYFFRLLALSGTWGLLFGTDLHRRLLSESLLDPRVFAGFYPFSLLPGEFLFLALGFWFISKPLKTNRMSHRSIIIALIFSPIPIPLFLKALTNISNQIIDNSIYAWWPSLFIPNHLSVLVLPISAILILASLLRGICFIYQICFNHISDSVLFFILSALGSVIISVIFVPEMAYLFIIIAHLTIITIAFFMDKHLKNNLLLLSLITLILASVFMFLPVDHNALLTAQATIQTNVLNWINDRDQVRRFALETNLVRLSGDDELLNLLKEPHRKTSFPAYKLWEKSDLSAITPHFGIEILDSDGELIDRFAPFINHEQISPAYLRQLSASPHKPIVESFLYQLNTFKPHIMGGITIDSDGETKGFLIIFLAAGPLTAIPRPFEWGHEVNIKPAFGGLYPQLPAEFSSSFVFNLIRDISPQVHWIADPEYNRTILIVPFPESPSVKVPLIIAALPNLPWHAKTAGGARLILLSILIGLPELLYYFFRFAPAEKRKYKFMSFRFQLILAFGMFCIVLPLSLSFFLRGLFRENAKLHRREQLHMTAQQSVHELSSFCFQQAEIIKAAFLNSGNYPAHDVSQKGKCILLDSQGHIVTSHGIFKNRSLPWATIAKVFNTGRKELFYVSESPGVLSCCIVLPVYENDTVLSTGTMVIEFPIEQEHIEILYKNSHKYVEIFARGTLCFGSEPDLIKTGFIPHLLDSRLYKYFLSKGNFPLTWTSQQGKIEMGLAALRDEQNMISGVLAVRSRLQSLSMDTRKVFNLLFIITVLLLGAGMLLAVIISRRFSLPLTELTVGARRVASGILDRPVKVKGSPEIIKLAETFNQMMSDISLQRTRLQQRHEFIAALLKEMSSGIIATDPEDRITTINPRAGELLNIPAGKFVGRPLHEIFRHPQLKEVLTSVKMFKKTHISNHIQCRFLDQGQIRHLSFTISELKAKQTENHGLLIVIDDITSAIRSTQLEAYSDMARRIAHEIKNPLTPIQLSIEHLRHAFHDNAPEFPKIFEQCTTTVLEEVRSLKQIATEFSKFSRFPRPQFKTMDIRNIIKEIVSMVRPFAHKIEIRTILPEIPIMVRIDHDQIKRAFFNIAQNAIQAMPQGGVLTIKLIHRSNNAEITIIDTGIGMDNETQMNLFTPYFSTKQEGIGLGLVITKATIDAHGGTILVKSKENKGTTFTIQLPIDSPDS